MLDLGWIARVMHGWYLCLPLEKQECGTANNNKNQRYSHKKLSWKRAFVAFSDQELLILPFKMFFWLSLIVKGANYCHFFEQITAKAAELGLSDFKSYLPPPIYFLKKNA